MKKRVDFIPVTCPECGSRNTRVYESFPWSAVGVGGCEGYMKERWHRCRGCGVCFASFERATELQIKNDGV